MQKQFSILSGRPKIEFRITRDSVCAADDADAPHEKLYTVPSFTDPIALTRELASGYLPTIAGYGHSWDCIVNEIMVATIHNHGMTPRMIEVPYHDENHVHFRYKSATY